MTLNLSEAPAIAASGTVGQRPRLPRVLSCLALNPERKFGSMEEQLVLLAQRFRDEGSCFLPLFVVESDIDLSQFHQRGVDACVLDLRRFRWRTFFDLRRIVRNHQIDLAQWNFMPPLCNSYLWALSLASPLVRHWFTDHNSRPSTPPLPPAGVKKLCKRTLLKRYGQVFCVSRFIKECLDAQQVWSNLVLTPHFINTERFQPDAGVRDSIRQEYDVRDRFVLLAVSYLIKEKGIDVAVRSLAELPENVVLWIVGDGPEANSLQKMIVELRLEKRVRLLGLQKHVQPFMQAADCFLCPSLWAEAAGLNNLEAQACGLPVVASRIGGIPEYVIDGETGLLFTPHDSRELAACVRRLVDDRELCDRFARQARLHAIEEFSPETCLPRWLDLYRNWKHS
jgi:glycosyltransferase involved in cell wall biosynthesis